MADGKYAYGGDEKSPIAAAQCAIHCILAMSKFDILQYMVKKRAVIFDMDGVIIDSQQVADKILSETAKKLGVILTDNEMKQLVGASGHDFWQYVKETYNLPFRVEEYQALYNIDDEIAAYKDLKPIDGIVELLKDLQEHNILIGLATTAEEKRMNAVLNLFHIRNFFNAVTSVNEIRNSKPNPEIYLLTAKKLNISPKECVVIEDSLRGFEAAKKAGMKCILYQKQTINNLPANTDLIISDFSLVSYQRIASI